MQLNNFPLSLRDKVAPTDSRYRPDQRALENGNFELGKQEKHRIEEIQRAHRK